MGTLIAISFALFCIVMVAATLLGLPGMWMMLLGGVALKFFDDGVFGWWTLGIAGAIVLAAEIAEFGSSAVGAKAGGASRKAMGAAVVGGIIGAIVGTFVIPLPVVGTIVGSAIGAGIAASAVELRSQDFEGPELRRRAARVGAAAAAGRFVAVLVKGVLALVLAIQLSVAAFL